jgi:hypothetical protein
MRFDDPFHDRHAEPCSALLRRKKWIKDLPGCLRSQAAAVIINLNQQRGPPHEFGITTPDCDQSLLATREDGVFKDISEYLFHTVNIDLTERAVGFNDFRQRDLSLITSCGQIIPLFSPGHSEITGTNFQVNWCSVTAYFFIETMQILQSTS